MVVVNVIQRCHSNMASSALLDCACLAVSRVLSPPRLRPMALEDPAYPFLTSSGIPSMSFHIITKGVRLLFYWI